MAHFNVTSKSDNSYSKNNSGASNIKPPKLKKTSQGSSSVIPIFKQPLEVCGACPYCPTYCYCYHCHWLGTFAVAPISLSKLTRVHSAPERQKTPLGARRAWSILASGFRDFWFLGCLLSPQHTPHDSDGKQKHYLCWSHKTCESPKLDEGVVSKWRRTGKSRCLWKGICRRQDQ